MNPSSLLPIRCLRVVGLHSVCRLFVVMIVCGQFSVMRSAAAPVATVPGDSWRDIHVELLPRGFQKNPLLNMTVVTEFTPAGSARPAPSAESPQYFVAHDNGVQWRGFTYANEKTPEAGQLAKVMRDTLKSQGLIEAGEASGTGAHQPELALFYTWGSNYPPDDEFAQMFPFAARRSRLERSRLVGGENFVREVMRDDEFTGGSLSSPFSFVGRANATRFMREQVEGGLYFVVISAYSYEGLLKHERRLLWRTSMTVDSTGLSMTDTLRPLLITAAPYVGREVPATALRRRMRRDSVELGPIKVIEDDVVIASK